MTPQALLTLCRSTGVRLRIEGSTLKLRGPADSIAAMKPILQPHKQVVIRHILAQFRFELEQDSTSLERVNNMAWEFMQIDGMLYDEAIKTATAIVAHYDVALCEQAYQDVRALWERTKDGAL